MIQPDYLDNQYYSDLIVAGLPCQAFSLAGKRLGELDPRGLLFYDFYRYVKVQQPKYFIIENVKGLLSDNDGKTFQNWIDLLGQSVNGNTFFFPHEDSLMYNLHWQVLNTKDYGLPQNRERVFLVGIRNDLPNDFVFPKGFPLTKRLKDVLETNVDEKYYLSDKLINGFISKNKRIGSEGKGFGFQPTDINGVSPCITARYYKQSASDIYIKVGFINQDTQASQVFSSEGVSPTITAGTHGYALGYIQEPQIGAMRGRNPDNPKSRQAGLPTEQMLEINKEGISNTLTSVQKDNLVIEPKIIGYTRDSKGKVTDRHIKDYAGTIHTSSGSGGNTDQFVYEPQLKKVAQLEGFESEGRIYDANGISRTIKNGGGGAKTGWYLVDDVRPVQIGKSKQYAETSNLIGKEGQEAFTIRASQSNGIMVNYRIRRLTPKECFRLQGYSDEFFEKCQAVNSDTQLYRQAGNTISVPVIQSILERLIK